MRTAVTTALCALAAGCVSSKAPAVEPAPAPIAATLSPEDCVGGVTRFIDLGISVFDQDEKRGWRSVADKPGCELPAADLIARYRDHLLRHVDTLYWHEAQILASNGKYPRAIDLMKKSLEAKRDFADWNDRADAVDIVYSLATIAFLKGDRAELEKQRAELAIIPAPENWAEIQAAFWKKIPDRPPPAWPLNLDVVDGLIACFGKPYSEAYSSECRPKAG